MPLDLVQTGFAAHATMAPFGRDADPALLSVEGKRARRAATKQPMAWPWA